MCVCVGGGPTCVERGGGGRAIGIVKQTLKPRIVGVGVGTWNLELGEEGGTLRGTWSG